MELNWRAHLTRSVRLPEQITSSHNQETSSCWAVAPNEIWDGEEDYSCYSDWVVVGSIDKLI